MILPALIDASTLHQHLPDDRLLIVDLCSDDNYRAGHIPGAVHIPPARLGCGQPPAPGKLPAIESLTAMLEHIGLDSRRHVVAYDDAGGSWAGRLIWTLALLGFDNASLLDGGRNAWLAAGLPLSNQTPVIQPSQLQLAINPVWLADKQEILHNLDNPDYCIWDARSAGEYRGENVQAARGGHIPGAIHLEWTELMDEQQRLLPVEQLQSMLDKAGLTRDKTITTHCQTHRRSGLTWFVARKLLGYPAIKAYPGSWSEWGNCDDTPIET